MTASMRDAVGPALSVEHGSELNAFLLRLASAARKCRCVISLSLLLSPSVSRCADTLSSDRIRAQFEHAMTQFEGDPPEWDSADQGPDVDPTPAPSYPVRPASAAAAAAGSGLGRARTPGPLRPGDLRSTPRYA
jgi:hypothetical protein